MRNVGILESREPRNEIQMHRARGAVTLLRDDDLGLRTIRLGHLFIAAVIRLAVDEGDHIGVLLDRSRLAKIAEHGPLVIAAPFAGTRKLRQRDYRYMEFLRQRLQTARN